MKSLVIIVSLAFLAAAANAEDAAEKSRPAQPVPNTNVLEKIKEMEGQAEKWAALQESIGRNRVNACIAAFGHKEFCACLGNELNWVIDFDTYIRIVTAPDTKPNPSATSVEAKAVNSVFVARERCVSKLTQ